MTHSIGQTGVSAEDLQRYFDGELTGAQAQELASLVDASPELSAEIRQLQRMGSLVRDTLRHEAQSIPSARFEQVWDEIEHAIDIRADEREPQPSLWARLWESLRPARIPLIATLGAAALALILVRSGSEDPEPVASVEPPVPNPVAVPESPRAPVLPPTTAEPAVGAEIHDLQFGGKTGRIARTGTVTVLYVEEDLEPKQSERSL